jgi:phage anti-repressor protein
VDARMLWENLESRQEFANWIKNRLADFVEGVDYDVFDKVIKNPLGGRPQTNYLLTLNTAKHICLLERSEPGRKIRQYLIEVEKLWNSDDAVINRALQKKTHELLRFGLRRSALAGDVADGFESGIRIYRFFCQRFDTGCFKTFLNGFEF